MMIQKTFRFLVLAVLVHSQAHAQYSWDNLPKAQLPTFKNDTFNIKKYGAIADGITLNTRSINNAIDDCSKKGGGVVLIPEGIWLTGPVVLKSNVNLHLNAAAILQFTKDFNQFPLVEGNYEGAPSARNQSPISGDHLVNIAITGKGIVDGNGDAWRMVGRDRLTESEWKKKIASGGLVSADGNTWYPSAKTKKAHEEKLNGIITPGKTLKDYEAIKDYLRPNLLVLNDCKKVLLEDVTFQNSPAWNLHPLLCEDLTLKNLTVKNPEYAQNGDGVDVESCKNVLIDGCTFDVGDDGICIKSGRDEEGRKRGKPTENMVVRNSTVYKAHGGFVIGSEMSGGAKNIFVYSCSFIGTDKGLRFKTARGRGGVVEDIYCRNIFMKDIVHEAIYFDMYYFTAPPKKGERAEAVAANVTTPQFRNFEISNIVCDGADKGIFMRGLPEMAVKNISISNVLLNADKGAEIIESSDIKLNNVTLLSKKTDPVIHVENSKDITIDALKYSPASATLFSIYGADSKDINLRNTDASKVKTIASFVKGANAKAITVVN
ncbi:glycoside hydrolase family 28 protein [Pinibacter aurantiacus]|uniref:Glycoside hydrolase family 28 protein n=1 Tax=Pinibacter aurantiacus TaxID=2851599 RepID=A0A9E2SFC0_9BACT|nr:glycoside hydrolase family 28 protein [Pinibacter aurantiacus]MBV4360388.1 glycoside hydrolase family 28 protein [Pinibacter aurantiacus]